MRVPQSWLTLDISPQAKTLLMAFCAYADEKGQSYHSYEQLGEVLNRSKTSVCGYVKELRETGLISCTKQTYGNGYNYRLLVKIVGWADILASWARNAQRNLAAVAKARREPADARAASASNAEDRAPGADTDDAVPAEVRAAKPRPEAHGIPATPGQNAERRVQNVECKDPKGPINQIPQNQTHCATAQAEWSSKDEAEWRGFRPSDSDPISSIWGKPREDILRKAIAKAEDLEARLSYLSAETAVDQALIELRAFVAKHRIESDEQRIVAMARDLGTVARTGRAIEAAIVALDAVWQPHWRKLPQPRQFDETIAPAVEAALPPKDLRREHMAFVIRAMVARRLLRQRPTR